MDHLINKYKKDELTPNELFELRDNLDSMTDEEVGQQLYADWLKTDQDISFVDENRVAKMKNNIDNAIGRSKKRIRLFPPRWAQIAASILLPISILFAVYNYHENKLIFDKEILFTTDKKERATVTLPDGTAISLNTESTLKYRPQDFNKNKRMINFSGEGHFQVFHNEKVPFLIHTEEMEIKVLGTTFNLSVREKDAVAELVLEEGCVSLSIRKNQEIILYKNQKAVLNRLTGQITVMAEENARNISAWKNGDMIFRNAELSRVLHMIEEYYDVIIKINCEECFSDKFSGTLPLDDLNEVLEILERSYHLITVKENKEIVMTNK